MVVVTVGDRVYSSDDDDRAVQRVRGDADVRAGPPIFGDSVLLMITLYCLLRTTVPPEVKILWHGVKAPAILVDRSKAHKITASSGWKQAIRIIVLYGIGYCASDG